MYDNYVGSGKAFNCAVQKYGIDNFIREILCLCDTEQEAYQKEYEFVGLKEVNDSMCYNQRVGGEGSKSGKENHNWQKIFTEEHKQKIGNANRGRNLTEEHKKKIKKSTKGRKVSIKTRQKQSISQKGRKQTTEAKQKIGNANCGENSTCAKLTEKQVYHIKYNDTRLHQWGGITQIAKEYGVHVTTISNIKYGYNWKHV